jgi:peptidyl-prolyl cis-trans isomerase SurA
MNIARLLALLLAAALVQAQYVDRVVASVDGTPVLWSDVEREVRLESIIQGLPPSEITIEQRNEALNHLIDTTLERQQVREARAGRIDSADVKEQIAKLTNELREQQHAANNDEAWQKLLQEYGLSQEDVREHLRYQIEVLEFVNLRFRTGTQINPQQVEDYYKNKFVPEMNKLGAKPPALASVRPKIEQVLMEQAVTSQVSEWLKIVRAQADVWRAEPFASMASNDNSSEKK